MKTLFEETSIEELPAYRVRVSERARRISIAFSPEKGLELILPSLKHERKGIEFLRSQQKWIKKKQAQYQACPVSLNPVSAGPAQLILPAIQQSWHLIYNESTRPGITVLAEANTLLIRTPLNDMVAIHKLLKSFVQKIAESHLATRLQALSQLYQLNYHGVSFGSHKTQWGSCSRLGKISLNIQLLFLPPELVDYVLVHELCHTRHFNHSKRFWALVEKCLMESQQQRLKLRTAKRLVPLWMLKRPGEASYE